MTAKKIDELESSFKPASEYNNLIFNLYLSYIRKSQLRTHIGQQTARLKEILEHEKIPGITSWTDIDRLSKKYQLWDLPKKKTGCAFKKIGRMLNGVGVLGPSWKGYKQSRRGETVMAQLTPETAVIVSDFFKVLIKQNRSQRTTLVYLEIICKFEKWLQTISPDHRVMLASATDLESYLDHLREKKYAINQIYSRYCSLNKFYRWCIFEKKLLINPAELVVVGKSGRSLEICSEVDMKALTAYVKNCETDPSDAFLITLILFFGFTIEQLCLAQLAPKNGATMRIILAANGDTYSSRYKRRNSHLDLPSTPAWFLKLQQRYESYWCQRYEKEIKHISVRRPLLLQENKWYNAPIEPSVIKRRLIRATKRALDGRSISWQVLHSSCGVIYTRYEDASILTKMGWSQKHTSYYVNVTKKIHSPSTNK